MIKKRGFPKIFFGWWTIVTASFLSLWGAGYQIYGFSALFKPISSELGFSRAATSVAGVASRFGGGLEAPLTGWLSDKFGPKWIIFFGVFLFTIGLILMNFINSLWAFYVVWGVIIGLGLNSTLGPPLDKAITNWFVKKRGMVQSIRWIFTGLSAVAVLPLITWLINIQGWRMACVTGGLLVFCIGLPLVWFGIKRHRPEYYGLLPDGAKFEAEAEADTDQTIDRGIKYAAETGEIEFTLRQAIRTPTYWMLVVAQTGCTFARSSVMMHLIPFLTDMGMDSAKAAATVSIAALFSLGARFATGFIADRISKGSLRFLYGVVILLQALAVTIFLLNPRLAMVYFFLIVWNIGLGGHLVLMSLIGGRYFGRKAFGSIRGSLVMFTMLLGILGPIYAGWIYDTTGSYITAFTTFAVILAFAAILLFFTPPPRPPAKVTDIDKFI